MWSYEVVKKKLHRGLLILKDKFLFLNIFAEYFMTNSLLVKNILRNEWSSDVCKLFLTLWSL